MKRVIFVFLVAVVMVSAQDVHFSQYYASPLNLNPAFTGVFNGKIRSNLNYRSQWSGFSQVGSAYTTYAASMDMRVTNIALKRNFMGIGFSFYNDRAGEAGLYTQSMVLSNSVGLNFSKKKVENVLAFGYQFGLLIRGLQYENLTFGSQYINNNFDPTAPTGERRFDAFRFGYDFSAGALWLSKPSDIFDFYLGASMFHVNQPNQSFFKAGEDPLATRLSIHAGANYNFGRMFDLVPIFMWQKQGWSSETLAGLNFMFAKKQTKPGQSKQMVYIGGLIRMGDAFVFTGGMQMKQTKIGLSYDVNLSPLTQASNFKGGPEISMQFIGNVGKRRTNFTIAAPRI